MAHLEAHGDNYSSSGTNGQPGVCRSAEDVELLNKLTAFTAAANRGEVTKALDAANLAFAHGMFKCGTQRTSVFNRASILSQCAQRCSKCLNCLRAYHPAGDLHASKISKDSRQVLVFSFNCGNYTQKHLRDAATAETKRTLSTSKSFTRVPTPFCNERVLRKKLSCALYWHQDLIRAMLLVAREKPVVAPLVRSHVRGVRYGISRQAQHYMEKLSDLCSKPGSSAPGMQIVSIEGLHKWVQTYCKAWMVGFQAVETEFSDVLDPALCASSSWVAQASALDTMRLHSLETVEASIAKDSQVGSAADAIRTGMGCKPVSGAVCGLFMDAALKAQEENVRLHNMVAAMRSNFGAQLQQATSKSTSSTRKDKGETDAQSKGNKRGIDDADNAIQRLQGPQKEHQNALPVSKSQQSKQRSHRLSLPAGATDMGEALDGGVLDGMRSMDLGADQRTQKHASAVKPSRERSQGATLQRLKVQSTDISHKDGSCKTSSDASTNSPMGGENAQQFQQLEGLDSLLDAELPTLRHSTASGSGAQNMSQDAEDPFAASEILPPLRKVYSPASAQLASQIDSCLTSAMYDSTSIQGDLTNSQLPASVSRPVAPASYTPAQTHQYVDTSGHSMLFNNGSQAPVPVQQQQRSLQVPWHQQQLQQHILQQQPVHLQDSQLAQCVPPWDHSSFMGASSFMAPPTGMEGLPVWPPPVAPTAAHLHGAAPPLPPQPHSSQVYIPLQHSGIPSLEQQHSMLATSMSDMGAYASAHTGGGTDVGHPGQAQYAPMQTQTASMYPPPIPPASQQIRPAHCLPAQPGNPFASAMASGNELAHMRSTSFAT